MTAGFLVSERCCSVLSPQRSRSRDSITEFGNVIRLLEDGQFAVCQKVEAMSLGSVSRMSIIQRHDISIHINLPLRLDPCLQHVRFVQ
jgi:hypothetical protein